MKNKSPFKDLRGCEIVLGVTGSIAAYKAADLVRRLQEAGAGVSCVLTPSAERFIPALTLSALSGRPIPQDLFDLSLWNMAHLSLAKKAQGILVAPCTADFLAALAVGRADTLLSALILAARVPVFLAPAMHDPMWTHRATHQNTKVCKSYGYRFIGPARGPLASGDSGWGRMETPERIVAEVAKVLSRSGPR